MSRRPPLLRLFGSFDLKSLVSLPEVRQQIPPRYLLPPPSRDHDVDFSGVGWGYSADFYY